jgi:hypothetical protein
VVNRMGGACSTNGRDEKCEILWSEDMKIRDHSKDIGVDCKIILEWILGNWGRKAWTGCI